ncbi:SIMPL domain-containing protein [Microbacterium sp.]|uniref:SIMPL domain-containing protein n=1 Tax=Microbacterium sp. TaxID=51671 RepID=UPI003A89E105
MSEVIITVRGESRRSVPAERATAQITVAVDGPERGAVIERIAAIAEPVRTGLAHRHERGVVAAWHSQRPAVWSECPENRDGTQLPLVHHATVDISATFTDTMALSDWLNTLAVHDGIQIGPLTWELAPQSHARIEREVAFEAVAVAVERAHAYAGAIGRGTLTPVEIADAGMLGDNARTATMLRASAIDIHPDDITIAAAVEARFRAT